MVELNEIVTGVTILLLVGILVGVSVILMDKMVTSSQLTTAVTEGTLNMSPANSSTMTYSPCTSLSSVVNLSNGASFDLTTYSVVIATENPCVITSKLPAEFKYNVTYSYGRNVTATKAIDAVGINLGTISTTWMSLIVTIMILGLIIGLVLRSFAVKQR